MSGGGGAQCPQGLPQCASDTAGARSQSRKLGIWGLVSRFTMDLQGDLGKVT